METVWPTLNDVFLTFLRWGAGLFLGTLFGLILSLLETLLVPIIHRKLKLSDWVFTIWFDFLRALPIIALVPLVQMMGVDEKWKIGLIAWAAMFPILLAIRQANKKQMIDTELVLIASEIKTINMFLKYHFPKALGGLLRGVEISIGVAWLSVVAAEWIGTYSIGFWAGGLGYKILKAHDANSWGGMIACLMVFGILGIATSWIWRYLLYKKKYLSPGFDPMCEYRDLTQ